MTEYIRYQDNRVWKICNVTCIYNAVWFAISCTSVWETKDFHVIIFIIILSYILTFLVHNVFLFLRFIEGEVETGSTTGRPGWPQPNLTGHIWEKQVRDIRLTNLSSEICWLNCVKTRNVNFLQEFCLPDYIGPRVQF